jgi:hypothetical protein
MQNNARFAMELGKFMILNLIGQVERLHGFRKKRKIDYAREFAKENAIEPEDIKEHTIPGFLYQCQFSFSGGVITVREDELNIVGKKVKIVYHCSAEMIEVNET